MSDDTIRIPIDLPANTAGADKAIKALERLAAAQKSYDQSQVKASGAAARLAADAARVAQAQDRAASSALRLAADQSKAAQAAANASAAQLRQEAASLRLAAAQDRANASVKRTASGLAILPRSFAGLTDEVQNQLNAVVGWGAAFTAAGAVIQSFADAYTLKANLDATTTSIELQLRGVRDSGQVFQEAAAFGEQYKFTQQEMNGVTQASVGILRESESSFTDLAGVLARMQVLAPGKSIEDAAFSVRELASGDITSIAEQFNISRVKAYEMRDAINAGADVVQVMKKYLDDAGISMDTLKVRTEGAMGAMNDLKRAQEELALAQAEWAQGPGMVILLTHINALRGATRLLSGDWDTAGQSLQANLSWYATYAQVLATTGDHTRALAAADKALAEGLGYTAQQTNTASGAWGDAADAAETLNSAMAGVAGNGSPMAASLGIAAGGALAVADAARIATAELGAMAAAAGVSLRQASSIGGTNTAAGGPRTPNFGGRAAGAAAAAASAANVSARANAVRGAAVAGPRGGGGGGGGSAASAADRAAQQAADIAQRAEDNAREVAERQQAAAEDRAERLAEIEADKGKRLAEIEQDTAERLADIAQDSAQKLLDIDASAAKKQADSRKQLRNELRAIDERIARDREDNARELENSVARSALQSRASAVADNLDLAGASDNPALVAREAAQQAAETARAAAQARAQAEADPAVGRAVYDAELKNIESRQALDEKYAERKAELAGDPRALQELDAYYQQAIAAQRDATEQEITEARQAADLKAQEAEAEKAEAIARAQDERRAIEAERRAQREAVVREAEQQRAETVAKAEAQKAETIAKAQEQTAEVEKAYAKSSEAIAKWADDAERDLQRVIDKAGEASRALADVKPAGSTGSTAAAAAGGAAPTGSTGSTAAAAAGGAAPTGSTGSTAAAAAGGAAPTGSGKAAGGPVEAGTAYPVGEKGREWFVPYVNGTIVPNEGGRAGASGAMTVNMTIVQQPGQDARALAREVSNELRRMTAQRY